jgi:hypothetical protein
MIGVYILIKDCDVLYIGQSMDVEARLYQHRKLDFTHYVVVEAKKHRLQWLEKILISIINPSLNINGNVFRYHGQYEDVDYLKNFKRRRHLVVYPNGSTKYYNVSQTV